MSAEIPDKSYFKIGEVSRILGVEPYNIRYWEAQFKSVKPAKTKSRQRLYRRRDIELLLQIKELLYDEGYTIAGAKKRLKALIDGADDDGDGLTRGSGSLTAEERRAYDDQLSKSQAELLAAKTEAETLHAELNRLRLEHRAQLELYDADREALVEKLHALEADSDWSEARQALEQRIAELRAEKRQLASELGSSRPSSAELDALKGQLAAQTAASQAADRELQQCRRQLKLLAEAVRAELTPLAALANAWAD